LITPVVNKKKYTYKDYLNTPDDRRYELIEGELIMTPSPVTYHQWISKNLEYELESFVRKTKTGRVFYAPYDVHLDDENVLQPDILFVSNERLDIIGEKNIKGAPDLVIEIISESTAYNDLVRKKKLYARFGVREYWIVDPGEKNVDAYQIKDMTFKHSRTFTQKDKLKSQILEGLSINLVDIFTY